MSAATGMFLEDVELARLTGFKIKSKQIGWLRSEGLPFRISCTGHPIVTRSVIEGRTQPAAPVDEWTPGLVSR